MEERKRRRTTKEADPSSRGMGELGRVLGLGFWGGKVQKRIEEEEEEEGNEDEEEEREKKVRACDAKRRRFKDRVLDSLCVLLDMLMVVLQIQRVGTVRLSSVLRFGEFELDFFLGREMYAPCGA